MKTSPPTGSAVARTHPDYWIGVTVEDIPPGWIDDMVKRLFLVLNRDLIRLETAQIKMPVERGPDGSPVPDDLENVAPVIAKRERLVANMQRTMERLAGMETGRSPARNQSRKKKAASANDNTLEKLECRIASLVEAARDPEDSSGSDA